MFASLLTALVPWLADLYLLSTVLLLIGLALIYVLEQPARRIVAARSLVAGLAALAMLATAPGWPRPAAIEWSVSYAAPAQDALTPTAVIETASGTTVEHNPATVAMDRPPETLPLAPHSRHDVPEPKPALTGLGLPSWRSILAATFTIGAALNLAWLALGAVEAVRLRRTARAAPPRLQAVMARVFQHFQHSPRVCLSTRIGLPVAVGMVRPMIVLPESFVAGEPDIRLEAALAHEWAHIQNGDLRWLALLRLLNVVLFAQPLFWWLRREMRADQEVLADAAAALKGDGRLAYAETLVGWARSPNRSQSRALSSAALALWERPSMLHRRVRVLLDRDYRVDPATSCRCKVAAACLGLSAALILSMVTIRPSVATAQEMKAMNNSNKPPGPDPGKSAATSDRFEYAGRVVDPEGNPVAGAKLHLAYFGYNGQAPPVIRATTDRDGRFRDFKRELKADFADSTWRETLLDHLVQVVATRRRVRTAVGWADTFKA